MWYTGRVQNFYDPARSTQDIIHLVQGIVTIACLIIMNSLEWRARKLEDKIFGSQGFDPQREIVSEQLIQAAKLYKNFVGDDYLKFLDLYKKSKELEKSNNEIGEAAKAELVLSYSDDLTRYLESLKTMTEKADKVLDIKNWPDFSGYTERLNKLQAITREQHLKSMALDKRTEELIEVYNRIITAFRNNISIWNQRLDACENQERNEDEDV